MLAYIILIQLTTACTRPPTNSESTHIRVRNKSDVDFEQVTMRFMKEQISFSAVPKGQASAYRTVSEAYRYGYVEVVIAGESFVLQPIDYMGERPLGSGSFTYEITVDRQNRQVQLQLVR